MALPTLTGTGRLVEDGEVRFSAKGNAVWSARLAFSSRRKNDEGNWVDGDKFFIRASAFGETAEQLAESLRKGDEVTVVGRLKLDEWESKEGEKRSAPSLLVDSIGATIRRHAVSVSRVERSSQADEGDAWSGTSTAEAPF